MRVPFIIASFAWLGLAMRPGSAAAADAARPARPNVVIILADDMGFSDAGCYGGEIDTPHLDQLAREGLRFTQFYNTSRCWSSRASLLTGYYAQEVRRDELPDFHVGAHQGVRPAWARLLPALLKPYGYRSYHSGKWHVDGSPQEGGFDRSFDYSDTDRHFLPPDRCAGEDAPLEPLKAGAACYASTAIADHAIRQLRTHARTEGSNPFFLYLTFTEPHFPLQAPPEDIELYRHRYEAGWDILRQERLKQMTGMRLLNCLLSPLDPDLVPSWNLSAAKLRQEIGPGEVAAAVPWATLSAGQRQFQPIKMAIHAAMVHRMDHEIGRVLDQLRAMGALDNTLILFLSDNGASAEQMIRGDLHDPAAPPGSAKTFLCLGPAWSSAANTPLRLHKSWVHEGGISTPFIVHWPAGIRTPGELRHDPAHLIDIAPTVLELAGGKWPVAQGGKPVPPPPGLSLLPAFAKDGSVQHEYLWFYHIGHKAIRVGNWKLVSLGGPSSSWELYDLATDRSETNDLASKYPDRVKALAAVWTSHMEEFRAIASADLNPASASPPLRSGRNPVD